MPSSVFGVRHHGPGSARSLRDALEALKPDCLLVEGPPDAADVLPLLAHKEMKPPVALLIYDPEAPKRAVYYPFAVFSPEWQAIQFALKKKTPVRFMDLPMTRQLALQKEEDQDEAAAESDEGHAADERDAGRDANRGKEPDAEAPDAVDASPFTHHDPLNYLASAAGYSDSERWWEHIIEHRRDSAEVFTAILEAMTALREAAVQSPLMRFDGEREARREAWMRQTIRAAEKEGFKRIAVVCGAWHAPVLAAMPPVQEDDALLKALPKAKVVATWVPWTYGRLSLASGYGAGIHSPGWYDFLWHRPGARVQSAKRSSDTPASVSTLQPFNASTNASAIASTTTAWLIKVARLLRDQDLDASSASVIEAVRLSEALATVRNRPLPGLPELNEATQTVLCFGDALPMRLIHDQLIVSERLGEVPDDTPMVPLAQDLQREQKRLRLPPEAALRQLDLDLRKETDLARSRLFHRLNLLGIEWGERDARQSSSITAGPQTGTGKGTFHELWQLQWQPEFAVAIIEAAVWGNTIAEAASARVRDQVDKAQNLPALTALLDRVLLAELPDAAAHLLRRLEAEAALASDLAHLMDALPPLANVLRYGNVRQTDTAMLGHVVSGLVARTCVGLPGACGSLNDEAATEMFERIVHVHGAVALLQDAGHSSDWNAALTSIANLSNIHGLVAGRCVRLLLEAQRLDHAEAARRFGLALSTANEPAQAAAWAEGFLKGSGLLLIHDEKLWQVLDDWVSVLRPDAFTELLALLRRTFTTFTAPERRQMAERVKGGAARGPAPTAPSDFHVDRANKVLPLVRQLLGLAPAGGNP